MTVAGCGGGGGAQSPSAHGPGADPAQRPSVPLRTTVRFRQLGHLPAPVQLPAVAPVGTSEALVMGGLDSADASSSTIVRISGSQAHVAGQLPAALHDAAAATI